MTPTRYTMFSGGEGSFRAAKIDRANHPDAPFGLVFTDLLYEDADTYRFLIEAAANVCDRPAPNWLPRADEFPDYRVPADVPIEQYHGNPDWRAFLHELRLRTIEAIPQLHWLVEGRDPWEIFRDRRFLGNSQVDLCSRIGKRELADTWAMANCRRVGELFGPPDVFAVGIGVHEEHRFDDRAGGGLGPRKLATGWLYHAPLIDAERAIAAGGQDHLKLLYASVGDLGVPGQRMYRKGYKHGNCGGFCIKAGMAHYANRFSVDPDRFAYDAMMEEKLGVYLGGSVSILTDRRGGGGKKPMTLNDFARRLRREPHKRYDYEPGESGCGCMVSI